MTVWTSPRPAWKTKWPNGFKIGNIPDERSSFTTTTSAFFPGVRLPTTSASPSASAPPTAAPARPRRPAGRSRRTSGPQVSLEVLAAAVRAEVAPIAENMSALHHTLVSVDSDTGIRCRRSCQDVG